MVWLNNIKPAQVDGTEGKNVTVKMGDRETQYTGLDLLLKRALPNFYRSEERRVGKECA